MASAAPPILPVTAASGSVATTGSAAAKPIPATADLRHRAPPLSFPDLLHGLPFPRPLSPLNLGYFRVNYIALLVAALAISLLSHPFSLLLLLALLAAWVFLYLFRPADADPLVLFRHNFSDQEIIAGLVLLTLLVVFLTSIGSLIVSALMVGAAVVCVHVAFRVPEDLFLDDQDSTIPAGGFLSFLSGAAASSGTAIRI
ncbi:hypothetical protein ZIOFF_059057 [Zingiber officinale]|uniref:PRA1 family protein n=1 Tax=Zingiber officinale TaxID=94328 RepID=A0A8J5F713_ZINOF|nr:hypothetical protein ZIOFF_059057 [Zingiber officinale]